MNNILVTGVGGPTPRSFVRAVRLSKKQLAQSFRFIGVDCNPRAYGLYDRSLFQASYLVPRADDIRYWDAINEIIIEEDIDAAIILPEEEVIEWSLNNSKLIKDILFHIPDYELAKSLVDKHCLHQSLLGTDLIPKFIHINPSKFNYDKIIQKIGDIFWIRSVIGSSGLGSLKIESESALKQWVSINPEVTEFLATEYLPGRNMACKMLYFDNHLKRTACAERVNYIMAKVSPSGITGNTSFGRLINEPQLISLSEKALKMVATKLDTILNGIFTVDFKETDRGEPKITEINIRHVAFTSSIAAGGANLPMDTLEFMFAEDDYTMERVDYTYPEPLVFLRDVDSEPIVMRESEFLQPVKPSFRL